MPANTGKAIRVPLASLRAVYEGPGRIGPHGYLPKDEEGFWDLDRSLSLLSGIRITAEEEPEKVLAYLNQIKSKFSIRGRMRRQMKWLFGSFSSQASLGRRVIYASQGYATHRVLVYRYFGKLLREYSYEDIDGNIEVLSAFEAQSYQMFPLARVDVLPPLRYLAGRYPIIEDYRDAVIRSAERIALEWYDRTIAKFEEKLDASIGRAASVICRLARKDLRIEPSRVWSSTMKPTRRIGTADLRRLRELGVRAASTSGAATIYANGGE